VVQVEQSVWWSGVFVLIRVSGQELLNQMSFNVYAYVFSVLTRLDQSRSVRKSEL